MRILVSSSACVFVRFADQLPTSQSKHETCSRPLNSLCKTLQTSRQLQLPLVISRMRQNQSKSGDYPRSSLC